MEIAFDAIGIEITSENAFNALAADARNRGEVSRLPREKGVLHGRCLKFGEGLEVWTMLYETNSGEIKYADCRPAFRARYAQKISPFIPTEFDEEGEVLIHGFIEDTDTEVLFELQNLTEVGAQMFEKASLNIGLCGLAYKARVTKKPEKVYWKSFDETASNVNASENAWSLCGTVVAFNTLRNDFSGNDLYWLYLDVGELKIEVLVNKRSISGEKLQIGAFVKAEIWLQGHILPKSVFRSAYEGVDRSQRTVDFWESFKRKN
jgi:hypothetical protein